MVTEFLIIEDAKISSFIHILIFLSLAIFLGISLGFIYQLIIDKFKNNRKD